MNKKLAGPEVASRRRFETVYQAIRERISMLDYLPGQRLSEEALAEEFGTSRTPIRRVLARLEDEGLLRSVQSVGTIVTDVDIETLGQTYRLRMELAELIGRLDPVEWSDVDIDVFRDLQRRTQTVRDCPDSKVFARINVEFFYEIMQLTRNAPYQEMSERLYFRTTRIWIKNIGELGLRDEIAIFAREVADVLAALEIGDLASVGHIRRSHISMSYRRLQQRSG